MTVKELIEKLDEFGGHITVIVEVREFTFQIDSVDTTTEEGETVVTIRASSR